MKIRFEEPEARIIVQNDNRIDSKSNFMFFIERGECIV
jgi:CRP-like cAMP-binding protein|tara:strand:+ start:349 stop:462 length:114 start_codon:yes stop_codon:yes gene_type:complete